MSACFLVFQYILRRFHNFVNLGTLLSDDLASGDNIVAVLISGFRTSMDNRYLGQNCKHK